MADELKFTPVLTENLDNVSQSDGQLIFDIISKRVAVDVSDSRYMISDDAQLEERIDENAEAIEEHDTLIENLNLNKQDKLTAGNFITIDQNNIISANVLTNYNDLTNKPIIEQDLNSVEFTPVANTYYLHTGVTSASYINRVEYFYDGQVFRPINGEGTLPSSLPVTYLKVNDSLPTTGWIQHSSGSPLDGENVLDWEIYSGMPAKIYDAPFGFINGSTYYAVIHYDNQTYNLSGVASDFGGEYGDSVIGVMFELQSGTDLLVMDNFNISTYSEFVGCSAIVETNRYPYIEEFIITSLTGQGIGNSFYTYNILNPNIKINSAVKIFLNDDGFLKPYEKTAGQVTVIRSSIPTSAIDYNMEIADTSAEGLFEVLNSAQVQSDWNETSSVASSYIKNKPDSLPQTTSNLKELTITPGMWTGSVEMNVDETYNTDLPDLFQDYITACNDFIYLKDKFLIGGPNSDKICYSYDGLTWQRATMPSRSRWSIFSYGKNKFISTDLQGRIAISEDGITWALKTQLDFYLNDITFGNNLFVGVGSSGGVSGNGIYYSEDGETWTAVTGLGINIELTSVSYGEIEGEKAFIATTVSSIGNICYRSANGIDWSQVNIPEEIICNLRYPYNKRIAFGNGMFIIPGYGTKKYFYSTDLGLTWLTGQFSYGDNWLSISYGNGKFIASAIYSSSSSCPYVYSYDGINWTTGEVNSDYSFGRQAYGNNKFILFGYSFYEKDAAIVVIPDKTYTYTFTDSDIVSTSDLVIDPGFNFDNLTINNSTLTLTSSNTYVSKSNVIFKYKVKQTSGTRQISYIDESHLLNPSFSGSISIISEFKEDYDKSLDVLDSSGKYLNILVEDNNRFGLESGHPLEIGYFVIEDSPFSMADEHAALLIARKYNSETGKYIASGYTCSNLNDPTEDWEIDKLESFGDNWNPYYMTSYPTPTNSLYSFYGYKSFPIFCDGIEQIDEVTGESYSKCGMLLESITEIEGDKLPYRSLLVSANDYIWAFENITNSDSITTKIHKYSLDMDEWSLNKLDIYTLPEELGRISYTPIECSGNIYIICGQGYVDGTLTSRNTIIKFDTTTNTASVLDLAYPDSSSYVWATSIKDYIYTKSSYNTSTWKIIDIANNQIYTGSGSSETSSSDIAPLSTYKNNIIQPVAQSINKLQFANIIYTKTIKNPLIREHSNLLFSCDKSNDLTIIDKKDGEFTLVKSNLNNVELTDTLNYTAIQNTTFTDNTNVIIKQDAATLSDIENYSINHQADWSETDSSEPEFIKNKPQALSVTTSVETSSNWTRSSYIKSGIDWTNLSAYEGTNCNNTTSGIYYGNNQTYPIPLYKSIDGINSERLQHQGLPNNGYLHFVGNVHKYVNNEVQDRWQLIFYIDGETKVFESDDFINWEESSKEHCLYNASDDKHYLTSFGIVNNAPIWLQVSSWTSGAMGVSYSLDDRNTWTRVTINERCYSEILKGKLYGSDTQCWLINSLYGDAYISLDGINWTAKQSHILGTSKYDGWQKSGEYFTIPIDNAGTLKILTSTSYSITNDLEVPIPDSIKSTYNSWCQIDGVNDRWFFYETATSSHSPVNKNVYVKVGNSPMAAGEWVLVDNYVAGNIGPIPYIYINGNYISSGYHSATALNASYSRFMIDSTAGDKALYLFKTNTDIPLERVDDFTDPTADWMGLKNNVSPDEKPAVTVMKLNTSEHLGLAYINEKFDLTSTEIELTEED